jgi:hypothetical protein
MKRTKKIRRQATQKHNPQEADVGYRIGQVETYRPPLSLSLFPSGGGGLPKKRFFATNDFCFRESDKEI